MKVVLTQDVPKLGDSGTIQTVKDGFARNYLIPHGMAAMATPGMIKQVEERQAAEAKRVAKLEDEMRDLSNRIDATRLEIEARVGEQGRLYGSITSSDVAERLSEAVGEEVDRRKVEMDEPIRSVGDYEIPVRLIGKLVPTVKVHVFDPDAPALSATTEESESDESEDAVATEETDVPEETADDDTATEDISEDISDDATDNEAEESETDETE